MAMRRVHVALLIVAAGLLLAAIWLVVRPLGWWFPALAFVVGWLTGGLVAALEGSAGAHG